MTDYVNRIIGITIGNRIRFHMLQKEVELNKPYSFQTFAIRREAWNPSYLDFQQPVISQSDFAVYEK
jgi:hypothetical protein